MWNLTQLEEALGILKRNNPTPTEPLDVWWSDDGLFVFRCCKPEEMSAEDLDRLIKLCWRYGSVDDEVCWKLWRSD